MDKTLTEQEIALLRRKLDLLLRTGQLLVESAADTNRVVRNLNRVAAYLGLPEEKLHIDVSYTMLVVNVSDGLHSFSKFQKCEKHGINMTAISEISKLSWRAIENDYSLDQYEEELERIKNKKRNYVPYVVAIGAGFACGGFCKLFGGDWMAFLFTSICAFAGFRVRARCMEFGINHYMSIAIAALISTCLAYVSSFAGLSETPYHPLLACALFIVPGVPLINFVDDMIDNYIQVGIVRAVNTVLMVCAMAFGIVIAMRLLTVEDVVIDKKFSELSMVPHDSYLVYAIAAAIAAMGFSMIFNIQRRLLWVVAVGGIIAVCTRNFVNFELGYGPVRIALVVDLHYSALVPCSQSCADDSFCHPDDSGSADVSCTFRAYQYARCGRRGDGGCFQRHHGFTDYSLHSAGSGGAQYLCPPVYCQG